ncbi:VanZ family protein [Lysobacter soyae]|uniref:VanZ family protein n=1 Tax=Lysobacter soyae TaxID=2764185 RepID=A0ABX8WQ82_9GAMM|nr:VanZ family protein [Lysobacter sp. CJ11]QYR52928.1 VanZ family protein [Lysobacter sp. CJ11]
MSVGRSLRDFKRPALWSAIWTFGIVLAVVLSLLPPADIPSPPLGNDKLGHFLAYFVLMAWAVMLYAQRASWVASAVLLFGLGIGMEYLQGAMHQGRQRDLNDIYANMLGVIAGFALCLTPLQRLLQKLDQRLPG